jgi:beta-lactamase regulating signal transducer with metallopeptidase domain
MGGAMKAFLEIMSGGLSAATFGPVIEVLAKSFVVIAAAAGLCLVCRRASAATRHLIWFLALAGLPCLALLSFLPLPWQRPLWSVSTTDNPGNQVSLILEVAGPRLERGVSATQQPPLSTAGTTATSEAQSPLTHPLRAQFSASWLALAAIIWAAGVLLNLICILTTYVRLKRLSRNAVALDSIEWSRLWVATRQALRLWRPLHLMQSSEPIMPLTWGWRNCVVLLPAEAAHWPTQRRRLVLLHELAHVKRWDCLTQVVAQLVCAFFWANPLVWLAARRMCVEREHACDDLVLRDGCKATDYATDLVEIARTFRHIPQVAAIAMARSSHLEGRIAAIVDVSRARRLRPGTAIAVLVVLGALVLSCSGRKADIASFAFPDTGDSAALREKQIEQLRSFAVAKEKQSQKLAMDAGEKITPEFRRFFNAATNGDWQTVTNVYESFKHRHPQYDHGNSTAELQLRTAYWSPVLELCLAYDHVVNCAPKYTALLADGIIHSIPAGSIYFGGTDPGRGVPTAFSEAHAEGKPFFTVTQNALADGTYLDYLRAMYGGRIYTPTAEDSQRCFHEYLADAQKRLQHDLQFTNEPKQIKPGEDVRIEANNKITVQGQIAVMSINGLLTKLIFDRNPTKEFFVEESFPLDWMYPYLEPHGLIMKINREPLSQLSEETVARDRAYWSGLAGDMVGDWLTPETPVRDLTAFADKIYIHNEAATKISDAELRRVVERVVVRSHLNGFTGDLAFVGNDYARRLYCKLRASIGGLYAWRADNSTDPVEKERITREADFAFRQAFALCPYSLEAVFRYVNLLMKQNRLDDALLIAKTGQRLNPDDASARGLVKNLEQMKAGQAR